MINIYFIEDEYICVKGLEALFVTPKCKIKIIGYSNRISTAIEFMKVTPPSIIVLDLFVQRSDPIENVQILKETFPTIPIVIYSSETSILWKWRMMLAGVNAYVTKDWEMEEFYDRICSVANGQTIFPGDLNNFLSRYNFRKDLHMITNLDLKIILLRKNALHYGEISQAVGLSKKAVEKRFVRLCAIFRTVSVNELVKLFFISA
jgi:DNA-binding NarL/FixJ family response regulator